MFIHTAWPLLLVSVDEGDSVCPGKGEEIARNYAPDTPCPSSDEDILRHDVLEWVCD